LLFKLQQLGIEGQPVDWVSNYLIDRRQRVFIGQSQSQCKTITSGTCATGFSFWHIIVFNLCKWYNWHFAKYH